MKALVTGLKGTVAPVLAQRLLSAGVTVAPWDRSTDPIDTPQAVRAMLERERPDWMFHLATGSLDWAEWAALACAGQGVKFLYTSSVSVFSPVQVGPFTVDAEPLPDDDYGRYKLAGERRVRSANPGALVARLGWQIGASRGGNHMLDHLERAFAQQGVIEASTRWLQATSHLADTADALLTLMRDHPAGLYHVDGNPGLTFFEVVTGLNRVHGGRWKVKPVESPAQNNLLLEARLTTRPINAGW